QNRRQHRFAVRDLIPRAVHMSKKLTLVSSLALLAAGICFGAGKASLVEAVKAGDRAVALSMIQQKVDVNAPEANGTTALHYAAYNEDVDLVERLLKAGAKPNLKNDFDSTPMSEAAAVGNAAIIKLLLKAGADANSTNHEGQTALMAVARTGRVDAAQ